MYVARYVFIILSVFIGLSAGATELDKCLIKNMKGEHRLDREEGVRACFQAHKNAVSKDSCYISVSRFKSTFNSIQLYNESLSTCFYDTVQFKKIDDCLKDTGRFNNASDHDEAVFYCYQIFQENLSKTQCLSTAKKMIFPSKEDYLKRHCLEN